MSALGTGGKSAGPDFFSPFASFLRLQANANAAWLVAQFDASAKLAEASGNLWLSSAEMAASFLAASMPAPERRGVVLSMESYLQRHPWRRPTVGSHEPQ